jgi:uncharacterized membrane protein
VGGGPSGRSTRQSRSVDRLINFSDAVVAVAVTIMALPLVDIPGPVEGETVWTVIADHGGEIGTFLFTFYVVSVLWLAHNRILNAIVTYDGPLFWLNVTWLVAIVLLPWVSSLSGSASRTDGGVDMLYWSTLALISILGSGMAWHIRRTPRLLDPDEDDMPAGGRSAVRGLLFAGYFMIIGLTSLVLPDAARWLPLGIIPLSIWLHPAREDQPAPVAVTPEEST